MSQEMKRKKNTINAIYFAALMLTGVSSCDVGDAHRGIKTGSDPLDTCQLERRNGVDDSDTARETGDNVLVDSLSDEDVVGDVSEDTDSIADMEVKKIFIRNLKLPADRLDALLEQDPSCGGRWRLSTCAGEIDEGSGLPRRHLRGNKRVGKGFCRHPDFGIENPLVTDTFEVHVGPSRKTFGIVGECRSKAEAIRSELELFTRETKPRKLTVTNLLVGVGHARGTRPWRPIREGICRIAVHGRTLYNWGSGSVCETSAPELAVNPAATEGVDACYDERSAWFEGVGLTREQAAVTLGVNDTYLSCDSCAHLNALTPESAADKLSCLRAELFRIERPMGSEGPVPSPKLMASVQGFCQAVIDVGLILQNYPVLVSNFEESDWVEFKSRNDSCGLRAERP